MFWIFLAVIAVATALDKHFDQVVRDDPNKRLFK